MSKQSILPIESAPPPIRETQNAGVPENDNPDRAFVHACAEPFVQVIQACQSVGRHNLKVRRNHVLQPTMCPGRTIDEAGEAI